MKILIFAILTASLAGCDTHPSKENIAAIAKSADGAVVSIIMLDNGGQSIAQGSGFVVSADGRIVTNYHVINNGSSAIAKLPNGAFFPVDGVLAFDKDRDIAVIKAHGEDFHTVPLGDSSRVEVGDEVIAIGNPLSLESTVSNGIISGIRTIQEDGGDFLQVTTPISPGSSGGPLFNMDGQVVGITTMYLKGGENLNFAVPIDDAKGLLETGFSKVQTFPIEAGNAQHEVPLPPDAITEPPLGVSAPTSETESRPHHLSGFGHLQNVAKIEIAPIWLWDKYQHRYFLSDIKIENHTRETIRGITFAITRSVGEQPEYIKFSILIEPGKYSLFSRGDRSDLIKEGSNGCVEDQNRIMHCDMSPGLQDISDDSQIQLKDYEALRQK